MAALADAYVAGLIDGEGWLSVIPKYGTAQWRCVIDVTMTHERTIRALQETFGGSVTFKRARQEHHQDTWCWRCYGKTAKLVLLAIRPHTITKRDDVERCIRFLKETGKW